MRSNKLIAVDTIIDVTEQYTRQLEQIAKELDFALSRVRQHEQRIINGDNTFFEQMFCVGAYQRCDELLEQYKAVVDRIRTVSGIKRYRRNA